jgi:general secretion pathway protein L
MSGRGILDADMATLGRWSREALRWWIDELATMVPAALRPARTFSGDFLLYRGSGEIIPYESGSPRPGEMADREDSDLAIDQSQCLERQLDLPAMNARDLRSYLAVEADRLLPLPAHLLLIDSSREALDAVNGMMSIRIGAIRRELADDALAAATQRGVVPARIGIVEASAPTSMAYDFAPQLRAEGKLPNRQNRRGLWWGAVGALVLLNVALVVWQDQQSVDRLQDLVAAQAPAVSVYRVMADRIARVEGTASATATQRARHDVLGDLGHATNALPDTAWVQRYEWNGSSLRLAGYSRGATDVAGAIRRDPRFSNVRDSTGDVQAAIPIGQPFDISADILRRRSQ